MNLTHHQTHLESISNLIEQLILLVYYILHANTKHIRGGELKYSPSNLPAVTTLRNTHSGTNNFV